MIQVNSIIVVVLVTLSHLPFNNAGNCEETETAHVKLDLAKQSISNAKLLIPKCHDDKNDTKGCSEKDKSLAHLNAAFDLISEAKMMCHSCEIFENKTIQPGTTFQPDTTTQPTTTIAPTLIDEPLDCSELKEIGFQRSGIFQIWPKIGGIKSNKSMSVYCDMETDGGGWIVIQRRGNFPPQRDFNEDWKSYKKGFGNMEQEFWFGNEKIYILTNQTNYSVRFDMVDDKGVYKYAVYDTFSIGDESSKYVLNIQNHSGNATNDMQKNHRARFATSDQGDDPEIYCARKFQSAFWYPHGCGTANLNGKYQPGIDDKKGIWWYNFEGNFKCLTSVEIKIRRKTD